MPELNVALVHDYLTQRGGAERVFLEFVRCFPGAAVHTALYDAASTFSDFAGVDVRSSRLNDVAALRRDHRRALPFLAPAFSAMSIEGDVVLCSSSGWAHGARVEGKKVVYCHNPARWLYQRDEYLGHAGGRSVRTALKVLSPALRWWDRRAAASADLYLCQSEVVARRIRRTYGIEPLIVPAPSGLDPAGGCEQVPGLEPGYFLCVSRLLPYKNVDAVVAAFASLPSDRLVVVGTGPERERIEADLPGNVVLLGSVSDANLRWLYSQATAVVAASYEDYGLTPLEGFVFGKPALALRAGGFLETVSEGRSGAFFDSPDPAAIAQAVQELRRWTPDPADLAEEAARFSPATFRRRITEIVTGASPSPNAVSSGS